MGNNNNVASVEKLDDNVLSDVNDNNVCSIQDDNDNNVCSIQSDNDNNVCSVSSDNDDACFNASNITDGDLCENCAEFADLDGDNTQTLAYSNSGDADDIAASDSEDADDIVDSEEKQPEDGVVLDEASDNAFSKDNIKATFLKFRNPRFSTAYIAKMAILTAISFLLYAFGKFNLPFMFPNFLEIQISELPALLAGFSMGPISACIVIVLKCLFKFPMSSTVYVGEATDILLGILFVLPASLIYKYKKDKKHALLGICVGSLCLSGASILVNRFISIPFYVELYFYGDFGEIVSMLQLLYPQMTEHTFYVYYLFAGVLPFNLLRCIIVGALTFVLYKRLSKILHWDGSKMEKSFNLFSANAVCSVEETYALAAKIADTLEGGEIILLEGDLGAGKTTFTKGLARALGVADEVTSPTFTILNVYEDGRLKLNHLDMYRIENSDELAELGIEECFDEDGVTVIEWNKFEHFDGTVIKISITSTGENERVFDISSVQ